MKKRIRLFLVVLFLIQTAVAQANVESKCPGNGKIITTNDNKKYCMSGVQMNYYSAFSWCQSLGLHLVSVAELCNTATQSWDDLTGPACFNLEGVSNPRGKAWTSTPNKTQRAWNIVISENKVTLEANLRKDSSNISAICGE